VLGGRATTAALIYLFALVAASVAASWLGGDAAQRQDLVLGAVPPGWSHPFGTDTLGRDGFLRWLAGARVSLSVAAIATILSIAIGVPYGAIAGFAGGRLDAAMMRGVDVLYGLPSILFVLLLAAWSGRDPQWNMPLLYVGLGSISWLTTARIVRAQILSLREREFVAAARLAGTPPASILFRHLVPHTSGAVLACATLTIPRVMIEEAFLSFLGLGVAAPRASWGTLLADGMQSMREHPWLIAFPALAMTCTLLAFYVLGDALSDALDPRANRP
jgi:oligopeptide transport system permease protein